MKKINGLAPGALFTAVEDQLQQNGFYQLSPDAIKSACGAESMTGFRVAIRVRENAIWRELEVPDKCDGGSPALQQELTKLRDASLEVLRGQPMQKKP